MDIRTILQNMTKEEKAALVSGTEFMYTNRIPRLGVPALRMSDGPHGLRVQAEGGDNGVTGSLPATAFPTAACTASGWNPENVRRMGEAIAAECRHYGVHILLGPGVNIKRNPLAGRNFEYFSEDPLLAGELGAAEVEGVQAGGVGVSVKHFALNNSENYRFMGDSIADERAMREIYLKGFERIVRKAHPATVMCAYNKINGVYCSQNKWLLTDVLRTEWGFDGLVMTDWGAMHDRVASLKAGLDLEMPGDTAICRRWILDGLADGTLKEEELDRACENILRIADRYAGGEQSQKDAQFAEHAALAQEIAEDCAVLLKNDGILPLAEDKKYFVAGELFGQMRYQGAGSSMINPTKVVSPKQAFDDMGIQYAYARGYKADIGTAADEVEVRRMAADAVKAAEGYDVALVFAGLTDDIESEGCDRQDMRLSPGQLALIDALCAAGKKVVVVLFGGSPVELPFADKVCAILNLYLPGQSGGAACADLLFGKSVPSGRLAETWPLRYEDVPGHDRFGKGVNEVYRESIYVGYRYYLTAKKPVRYPFGYGLSYTSFAYRDLSVEEKGEILEVSCTLSNTGARRGAEVVQLYVKAPQSGVFKPEKELRAFQKVYLAAGESERVTLTVKKSELCCFVPGRGWTLEGGLYEMQICSDCTTVQLCKTILIHGEKGVSPYSAQTWKAYAEGIDCVSDAAFEAMSGQTIPVALPPKPLRLDSRFTDLKSTFLGRILYNAVLGTANRQMKAARKLPPGTERDNQIKGALFLKRVLDSNSILTMSMSAGTHMPYNIAQGFVALANGKLFRGIKCFCTKIRVPALPKDKEEEE